MTPPPHPENSAPPADTPALALHDHAPHHPTPPPDLLHLSSLLSLALPRILAAPGPAPTVLTGLPEVEISLLDDQTIAAIHADFLDDPTPTDVITFHHGEILVSVETAAREAAARQEPALRETALYIIHGLLHLHGHTDAEPAARATMHAIQDQVLDHVWPPGPPN